MEWNSIYIKLHSSAEDQQQGDKVSGVKKNNGYFIKVSVPFMTIKLTSIHSV